MLLKIKRQTCLDKFRVFPQRKYNFIKNEEELFYPNIFNSCILTIPSKSFKGQARVLALELSKLAIALYSGTLIFLGDTETPWRYQHNDYKPVREALDYLAVNRIGKQFNGALQISSTELPKFIQHLAWLVRCNAALPYFHFIDQEQSIIGSICKYGNLHLETLNKPADELLRVYLQKSKFEIGDKNSCFNPYGESSVISGRQTMVLQKFNPKKD